MSVYSNIFNYFQVLCEKGQVYELRCPKAGKFKTISGYFNDIGKMTEAALALSGKVEAVYVTLNPVKSALLARACNQTKPYATHTTADADVVRRRWLLLDFDPVRPAGIMATEAEKRSALERAARCRKWLREQGWPDPLFGMSGNGAALLYRIDLLNDEASQRIIVGIFEAVAAQWDDDAVKVDRTVFNASRITKVYGTKVCKGDSIEDRPHRTAQLVQQPDALEVVSLELLRKLARPVAGVAEAKVAAVSPKAGAAVAASVRAMERIIAENGINVLAEKPEDGTYARRWILERCPFCGSDDKATMLSVSKTGAKGFKCHHNRCVKRKWKQFKEQYGTVASKAAAGADRLTNYARDAYCFWRSPDGQVFATPLQGVGNYRVGSEDFTTLLTKLYFDREGIGMTEQALQQTTATLKALALSQGEILLTYRRVARLADSIEIDLGDDTWNAAIITKEGWRVGKPAAKFLRTKNTAALPLPVRGGSIDLLRPLVNVEPQDFGLFVGCVLDALKGQGPYFVSALTGEQGSSKSTMLRIMQRLLDPVLKGELLSLPRDERDFGIAANSNFFLAYDNVSKLAAWQSDAFCRSSTGGGYRTRALYSNDEETVFDFVRPIALNGIEEFVVAGDLVSRCVPITAKVIPEEERKPEATFWAEFDAVRPRVLGALFDALVAGLQNIGSVTLPKLPRMADSAQWIAACAPALGWSYEDWWQAYQEATATAVEASLEQNLPGKTLLTWFQGKREWVGTAAALREQLLGCLWEQERRYFPANAQSLSNALTRAAPALRGQGIHVEKPKKKKWLDGNMRSVLVLTRTTPPAETMPTMPNHAEAVLPLQHGENMEKHRENVQPCRTCSTFSTFETRKEKAEVVAVEEAQNVGMLGMVDEISEKNQGNHHAEQVSPLEHGPAWLGMVSAPAAQKPTYKLTPGGGMEFDNGWLVRAHPDRRTRWQTGCKVGEATIWHQEVGPFGWAVECAERGRLLALAV